MEPYTHPCGEGRKTRTRDCVGEGVHYKFHCDGEKVEYDCPDANCEAITTMSTTGECLEVADTCQLSLSR